MDYTTTFSGEIAIDPPLNPEEISYLKKFNVTRRMARENGPYYVDGSGYYGQGDDNDIEDYNRPPPGQPGLWCQWTPTDDGKSLVWDEGEKFYDSAEWMKYIIDHFLQPGCKAKDHLGFLQGNHVCNGVIEAQGEDADDRWDLVVMGNVVATRDYTRVAGSLVDL